MLSQEQLKKANSDEYFEMAREQLRFRLNQINKPDKPLKSALASSSSASSSSVSSSSVSSSSASSSSASSSSVSSARKLVIASFNDFIKPNNLKELIENFKYFSQPETSKITSNSLDQTTKIYDSHSDNLRSQVIKQFKLNIQELLEKISDEEVLLNELACGYTLFEYLERSQAHVQYKAPFNNRNSLLNETNQTLADLLTKNSDYSTNLISSKSELNIKALFRLDELFQKTHTLLQISQNSNDENQLYTFIVNNFLNFFDSHYENRETIKTKLNETLLQKFSLYYEILSFFRDHNKIEALTQRRNMPDTPLDLNTETMENFLLELIQAYIKNPCAYNSNNSNDIMRLLKLTVELGNPYMVEALIQGRRPDAYEEKEIQLIASLISKNILYFHEFIYVPELDKMQPYSWRFIDGGKLTFQATLLHIAVIHGHNDVVKLLCSAGGNINTLSKGDVEFSPLNFAEKMNHDEIRIYLLENDKVSTDGKDDKISSIWKRVKHKADKIAQEQFQAVLDDHKQLQNLIDEYGPHYPLFSMRSDGLYEGDRLHNTAFRLNRINLSRSIYEIFYGPLQINIQYPYLQRFFRIKSFESDFVIEVNLAKQRIERNAFQCAAEHDFEHWLNLLAVDNIDSRSNLLKLAKNKHCYELAYKTTTFFTTDEEKNSKDNQEIIYHIAQDCFENKQYKLAEKFFNLLASPSQRIACLGQALDQLLLNYLLSVNSFEDVNDCIKKLCEISGKHPLIAQQMSITLDNATMNVLTMISKQDPEGVLLIKQLLLINTALKELIIIDNDGEEISCSEQLHQLLENSSCEMLDDNPAAEAAASSLPMEQNPHEEQRNIVSQQQSQNSGLFSFLNIVTTSDDDEAASSFTQGNRSPLA